MVSLSFTPRGAALFEMATGEHVGKRLAIVLDGTIHSAPVIQEKIAGGTASISGQFTPEEAQVRFGFLMNAFKYGAPPHGGLAFGFDRLCSLFGGSESIRDYIAFPKNNAGRDVMLDAPGYIDQAQLDELYLELRKPEE